MKGLVNYLSGKKTYLIVVVGLVYIVLKYAFDGVLDTELLLEMLALAGLRAGVAKL